MPDPNPTAPPLVDAWLRRAILILIACVILAIGYVLWRVSVVARQVEQATAKTSERLDRLAERLGEIERKGEAAVGIDDLEATLDRMGGLRQEFDRPGSLDEVAKAEITHLLNTIRTSGLHFEAAGERDGATQFYLKSLTKYRAYDRSLRSTEDFIHKLVSKSMSGDDYAVVLADGSRTPLTTWLTAALAAHRAAAATQPATMPTADGR